MLLEATAAVAAAVGSDLNRTTCLPVAEFEVLLRLSRTAEQRVRMTELAAQVGRSTSGLTRLVDRMEAAGLVRREACPTDKRGALAVLTERGGAVLAEALPDHLESLERHLAEPLGPDGLAEIERLLRRLRSCVLR